MTSGDPEGFYNYVVRCQQGTSIITIRACDDDAECLTIADAVTCGSSTGDNIALMVEGEGDDTELCAWEWDQGSETWDDPSTWKNASFCVSEDGIGLLAARSDCGGETVCEVWGSNGPDDLKGFPADTQNDVGLYTGNNAVVSWEWFMAGDNP
jgi:hypothetical protein